MRQRLKDLQREPLASLVVIQVGRYGQRDTVWSTEVFRNDGFDPMQHFERGTIGKATHLLGFYTLDGEPLNFTEKGQPHAPERTLLTVHIAEPLAAGATQLVLRVEQRISVVQKGKDGAYVVRAPGVDRRRAGWYVRAIETPDGQFQTWSATESDRQAPLAVTFRYP